MTQQKRPACECIDNVRDAPAIATYWGNWLVKGAITLASGYGGISKTTFFYCLVLSLMDEGQFLGVDGHRKLKTLYCDLESSRQLQKARMKLLGKLHINHPNFYTMTQQVKKFKELQSLVGDFIETVWTPDIVIIDPLSLAFPETQNENSNAEATRQSNKIRAWCNELGITLVLVSHSSKLDLYGVGHNRGASARSFLCDVAWNFHRLGDEFPENQFVLHIPKNRWLHDEFFQCIEAREGEFIPIDTPPGLTFSGQANGLSTYQMQLKIQELMKDGVIREVKAIMAAMGLDPDKLDESVRRMFYRALTPLVQADRIDKVSKGFYKWSGSCIN